MAFPLSDDNDDRHSFPVVNVVIIALNIFVFVVLQQMGENARFTNAFSTVPAEILSGKDLVSEPRREKFRTPQGVQIVEQPGLQVTPISVYLTLLTSMFMHGGFGHLAGNMWFLWVFGDNVEDDLGRLRYVFFYLLCGLLASLAHVFGNQAGPSALIPCLGASGAISGIMGAYLFLHPHRRVTVMIMFRAVTDVPAWMAVGMWFLFQVINGLGMLGGGSNVAYGAHVGGFLAGAALIYPFMLGRRRKDRTLFTRSDDRAYGYRDW